MIITKSKFLKALLFLIALGQFAFAQQENVRSKIADGHTGAALTKVNVKLRLLADTSINYNSLTDETGTFSFSKIQKGDYEIKIHSLGYTDTLIRFSIPEGKFKALPPFIDLRPSKGIQLKEVTIVDNTPAVRMKGDTTEYNAAKFKTKENANVEDLLRKLPGVNIDKSGTIKAQGEVVQRVLVDGKEFFGSDPSVATRNLPADMIQKVQVLDKKSEMEEFTGVADGQKMKTINLITKKNMKRGYFGNANAGIGNDSHYEGGVNVNSFVNEAQASLILKGNDVNKSGFSGSELLKLLTQDNGIANNLPPAALAELSRMKGVKIEGEGISAASLARPTGLTDTKYGGLNFNNDWGDKLKLRSSYFFNRNNTTEKFDYNRQYLIQSPYNYLQAGERNSLNHNQRIDLSTDIKLSPSSSIKISPSANLDYAKSNSSLAFSSATTGDQPAPINDGTQQFNNTSRNNLISASALFRHQFKKKMRTLMFETRPEQFHNEGDNLNQSVNNTYGTAGKNTTVTDQQTLNNGNVYSISNNLIFTEPIAKSLLLQAGQQFYYSHGKYLRTVNNRNGSTGGYDLYDMALSDNFSSDRIEYNSKLSLSGSLKKLSYTLSGKWKQSQVKGSSILRNYNVDQSFSALLPSAFMEYKFDKKRKLTFNYQMDTKMPSVANLQPTDDNTDPLFIRRGNPDLDQEKTQNFSLVYRAFTTETGNSLYATMKLNWFNTQIRDNTIVDFATGKQLIIPVNLKGNYNTGLSLGKTMSLDKNGSSITAEIDADYSKNGIMNNNVLNNTRTFSLTPQLDVNYYLGNKISLSARGSATWNSRRFSAISTLPENNWQLNYSLESIVILPFKTTLEAGAEVFSVFGLRNGYNNNVLLLNTSLNKEIGKQFSLKIEGKDLLNRNQNIDRISGNGYIEDRKINSLGRYFQVSAIYKFRHFPKAK